MQAEQLVNQFIHQIDKFALNMDSPSYFADLITIDIGNGEELMNIVQACPSILTELIANTDMTIFDYFYEKMIADGCSATVRHQRIKHMSAILKMLPATSSIKNNSFYILNLQSTNECHNEIFILLFTNDFEIGHPESLVYTLIARGELTKVKCIADIFIIEDFPAIFDIALRYGRFNIINYFIDDLQLNVKLFGKVIDFDNLKDASVQGQLYWQPDGSDLGPPENGKQDYGKCLDSLVVNYEYPITVNTLYKWCDLIESRREIKWDTLANEKDILVKLKSHATEHISTKHDFGKFNSLIHNKEDMETLISTNHQLQQQIYELQLKYENLLDLYRRQHTK